MYKRSDELIHETLESIDTSQLEKFLSDLERLARFGATPIRISNKKQMIQDHIRFLLAKALREFVEKKDAV